MKSQSLKTLVRGLTLAKQSNVALTAIQAVTPTRKLSTIRTVDVSEISKNFTAKVEEDVYKLDKQVKSGNANWNSNKVSDRLVTRVSKGCLETISNFTGPQKEELTNATNDFNTHKFPILHLKGISQKPIELPASSDISNIDKTPQYHAAASIFIGWLTGPLGLILDADEESNRIVKISPKASAPEATFDSTKPLKWHTDFYKTPAHIMPENIALYTIQNQEKLTTSFLPAKLIFESLPDKHKKVLLENIYSHKERPYRADDYLPIFRINKDGSVGMQYSGYDGAIKGTTPEARESLAYLHQKIADLSKSIIPVTLEPGDILTWKNTPLRGNVIHSRNGFQNKGETCTDEVRRLLLRTNADHRTR